MACRFGLDGLLLVDADAAAARADAGGLSERGGAQRGQCEAQQRSLHGGLLRISVMVAVSGRTGCRTCSPSYIASMNPLQLAEAVRQACVQAALAAYEDAGIRGLCVEGRWEVAVGAIRSLDLK